MSPAQTFDRWMTLAFVGILIASFFLLLFRESSDPIWHGKPLNSWLADLGTTNLA